MKLIDLKTFPSKTENKLRLIEYGLLKKKNNEKDNDKPDNYSTWSGEINVAIDGQLIRHNVILYYNTENGKEHQGWVGTGDPDYPDQNITIPAITVFQANKEKAFICNTLLLRGGGLADGVVSCTTQGCTCYLGTWEGDEGSEDEGYVIDLSGNLPKDNLQIDITISKKS